MSGEVNTTAVPNPQGGGPLAGAYPVVGVYGWFLNIVSMSMAIPTVVKIGNEISDAFAEDKIAHAFRFSLVLVLVIGFFGVQFWTRWYLTLTIGTRLYQWGFTRKIQRWFLFILSMNLAIIFINFKTIPEMMWVSAVCLSVVATISLSHNQRDRTGLKEGLSTCFLILFLTHLNNDPKEYKTIEIGCFCLITAILCFICSIDPAPETDANRIADLERQGATSNLKVDNMLRGCAQRVEDFARSSSDDVQIEVQPLTTQANDSR